LSVAEGRLQLAQETGDFEHLEAVAQAHNRMRNLIDELLRIARGEDMETETVSLATVAEEAWSTVSAEGAALVVDDVELLAHSTQLRRLFENLFWNALEHGEANEIRVGPLRSDGFFVEDDGVGIPPGKRDEVVEAGYSTRAENPGYGLHIVDGIAELHGWKLAVTASDDGGARFEVTGVKFVTE
jgi:signal transduction histidine kinase